MDTVSVVVETARSSLDLNGHGLSSPVHLGGSSPTSARKGTQTTVTTTPIKESGGDDNDFDDTPTEELHDEPPQPDKKHISQRLQMLDVLPELDNIISGFRREIRYNIFSDEMPNMLASCLDKQPSGAEKGLCLAVDLGGSTFRVALVQLNGVSSTSNVVEEILHQEVFKVDDTVKNSESGDVFFGWMVDRIESTLDTASSQLSQVPSELLQIKSDKSHDPSISLPMGLSWSFPFKQTCINSGLIQSMGKGYNITEKVKDWDLKQSFERVFSSRGLNIQVNAVVNDGAASFIANAYLHPNMTKMALILGTGLNAAVMTDFQFLDVQNRLRGLEFSTGATSCLVNTEASMLGTMPGVLPETAWDRAVDSMNEIPGFQPLETKCSGRYLGEISRRIIRELAHDQLIALPLGLSASEFLPQVYSIDGRLLSDMEQYYGTHNLEAARKCFLDEFPGLHDISLQTVEVICQVFVAVSSRSCALTAACVIALASEMLTKDQATKCCVAYTGTVIEKYYGFLTRTQHLLAELGKPRGMNLELRNSVDGSVYGPAIAASMYAT